MYLSMLSSVQDRRGVRLPAVPQNGFFMVSN
nr:MAG TPA: hypothetical protein [Caudoviricetes sp.]